MASYKIIHQSDVSFENCTFIVVESLIDGTKIALYIQDMSDYKLVYTFEVPLELPDWADLDGINESCDTSYTFEDKDTNIIITALSDICWHHGALNFDTVPCEVDDINKFIDAFIS